MRAKHIHIIFLGLLVKLLPAQNTDSLNNSIIHLRSIDEAGISIEQIEEIYHTCELHLTPIVNLNRAKIGELQGLEFLTDFQVKSLWNYLEEHRPVLSVWELILVPGFDSDDVKMMTNYVFVDGAKELTRTKKSRGTLSVKQQWSESKQDDTVITNENYEGGKTRTLCRLNYDHRDKIMVNFLAEKDPGERFGNEGFDFYSGNIHGKNLKRVRNIVVGDYNARFGQGLTLWNGASFGSPNTASIRKRNTGISPYVGSDENKFFRGIGAELSTRPARLSLLLSRNTIDATMDTTGSIATRLQTTGLHRTPHELASKHRLGLSMAAINTDVWVGRLNVGMTGVTYLLDKPLQPDSIMSKEYSPRGYAFSNLGLHLFVNFKSVDLFGEIATDEQSKQAMLAGIETMLRENVGIGIVYRNYSPGYNALYSSGISQKGETKNERGLLIVVELRPDTIITIRTSCDYYEHPCLSGDISSPWDGYSLTNNVHLKLQRNQSITVLHRYSRSTMNVPYQDTGITAVTESVKHSSKLMYSVALSTKWAYSVNNTLVYIKGDRYPGYALFQDILFSPNERLGLQCRYYFYSTDTGRQLSVYEPDASGGHFTSLGDHGTRYMAKVTFKPWRRTNIAIKYARLSRTSEQFMSSNELSVFMKYVF